MFSGETKESHHAVVCSEKDHLITATSTDSVHEPNEKYSYAGRTVHISIVPDRYKLLEEVDDTIPLPSDKHVQDNVSKASNEENEDFVLNRGDKQANFKYYLTKRWHSKSAKRVRKVSGVWL